MLIKNFYNLYGGLSKTKKSLKKNRYKDYLTYLFAYLFIYLTRIRAAYPPPRLAGNLIFCCWRLGSLDSASWRLGWAS